MINSKEGWVPSYVLNLLTSSPRRGPAWTFRKFRKPSFSGSLGRKDSSGNNSISNSPTTPSKPFPSLKGTPIYVMAGENIILKSCTLPKTASNKDPYNGVLWRAPDGNVLLPGTRKYDMRIVPSYEASGIESKRAELTINGCEFGKDSGDYSVSLVPSSTSEDTTFLYTISLLVRCKKVNSFSYDSM